MKKIIVINERKDEGASSLDLMDAVKKEDPSIDKVRIVM